MRQAKASLHGVEWVGTSIRMHTDYLKHSCEDSDRAAEEDPLLDRNKIVKSSQSTLATGIVAQYCPGIDECFVVFDETLSGGNSHQDRLLIPRWLNLEALAQEQEDFLENESASVFDGSAFTIVSRHETIASCSSDSCFIDENVPVSILDRTWLERRSSLQSDTRGCTLCLRGDYDRYKNANGECKLEDYNLEHCVQCGVVCHRYCMPMQKIGLVENQEWWCWACTGKGQL